MKQALKYTSFALALLTGCATAPRRPYSAWEVEAFTHAIIGQSLDVVSTSMLLQDDRFSEANPLWWDAHDAGSLLAGKMAVMGAAYLVGEWRPEWRRTMWWMFAGGGYGAAAWNTSIMIDAGVNPWRDND